MSWFSNTSIDEQVEKATAESLPSGEQDLGLNLEICDMIRSKTVPAKDAMRSLKRRLLHKNPNVQIAALHLIDICVKNGGNHFLVEVASREFMDTVVLVIKPSTANPDVKTLGLELVQNWANAFQGQLNLVYVETVYKELKAQGLPFPPVNTNLSSSFVDSSAPPEWVDSDTCMDCGEPFSFVNRKHHCRNCGRVYLQKHCNRFRALPHYGINEPVRVCDDCYDNKLIRKDKADSHASIKSVPDASGFDQDLKRALELSLQDTRTQADLAAHISPVQPQSQPQVSEEMDDDMKAAIEASLRDFQPQPESQSQAKPKSDLYNLPELRQTGSYQNHALSQTTNTSTMNANNYANNNNTNNTLTSLEQEALHKYVRMVQDLEKAPPGAIVRDPRLQELNDTVLALRPKLARELGTTIDKCETLVDMHGKLTTVMRFYDQLLEARLAHNLGQSYQTYPQYAQGPSSTGPTYGTGYGSVPSAPSAPSMPSGPYYDPVRSPQSAHSPQYSSSQYAPPVHEASKPKPEPKDEPVLIEL